MRRGQRQIFAAILAMAAMACGRINSKNVEPPVDLSFEIKGERHYLSELRGRPLVLVLIRTSEIASQAYAGELKDAFGRIAGSVRFLVLTIEPLEAPFVEPYAEFENLPFSIGVAEKDVALGRSALGIVPVVPSTYLFNSRGEVVSAVPGVLLADTLVELAENELMSNMKRFR